MPTKQAKKTKPSPFPPARQDAPDGVAHFLVSIHMLDASPYKLAAAIDWMRQVWKGETNVLSQPDFYIDAMRWIDKRETALIAQANRDAAHDTLRAAVTS